MSDNEEEAKVISPPYTRTAAEEAAIFKLKANFEAQRANVKPTIRKTFIVDELAFEKKFLRCPVCVELYSEIVRPPKILPCHHAICLVCLVQSFHCEALFRKSLHLGDLPAAVTIICPKCCIHFISTEEGLQLLPTDHRIIQLIDFVQYASRQTINFCNNHKDYPLNFFCELCGILVCRDCTSTDHKEADGHPVIDLESVLPKYLPVLDKAMSDIESEKETLQEKRKAVDTAIEDMEQAQDTVVKEIHESFEKLRALLNEREKEICEMAESEISVAKRKLKDKKELIEKRKEDLQGRSESLKAAKETGDAVEIFKVQKEIKEYKPIPPIKIPGVDDGMVTKFTFTSRDENVLANRIKNFGDFVSQTESTVTTKQDSTTTTSTTSYESSRYTPTRTYSNYSAYRSPYTGSYTRSYFRN